MSNSEADFDGERLWSVETEVLLESGILLTCNSFQLASNEIFDPTTDSVRYLAEQLGFTVYDVVSDTSERSIAEFLGQYIAEHADHASLENRDQILEAVLTLPLPVFGSPPHDWVELGRQFAPGAGGVAVVVAAAATNPLLAVVMGGVLFVIWFGKPHAKLLRRATADRLARKLHTRLRDDELD